MGSFFKYLFPSIICIGLSFVCSCTPNESCGIDQFLEDYYSSYQEICTAPEAKPANMMIVSLYNNGDSLDIEIFASNAIMDTTIFNYGGTQVNSPDEIDPILLGLSDPRESVEPVFSVAITKSEEVLKLWGYYFWKGIPVLIYSEKNIDISSIICLDQLSSCFKELRDNYVSNDIHYCYFRKHYCMKI